MSFQPVIPLSGLAGWRFLERTLDSQKTAFDAAPSRQRDTEYFRDRIGAVATAEDLVADRRLLRVALGAFGLTEDIDNRFFIKKVLEDGTLNDDALSQRLADKRYAALSAAFGFGDFETPRTRLSTFPDEIISTYQARSFEVAVGERDETLRLAMTLSRELPDLSAGSLSDDGKWYTIMGNPPLRSVFETVLGLPSSFAQLDLDRQLSTFREKLGQAFGSGEISQFSDPGKLDSLRDRYLLRAEAGASLVISPANAALTLLQSASRPLGGIF